MRSTLVKLYTLARPSLIVITALAALFGVFITFDEVEAGGVSCGSPSDSDAEDLLLPASADECTDKLQRARSTRLVWLAAGVASGLAVIGADAAWRRAGTEPRRQHRIPDLHVQTDRLVVRVAVPGDVRPLVATIDDEMQQRNGWSHEYVAGFAVAVANPEVRVGEELAIVERATDIIVGAITTFGGDVAGRVQLGWWIGPAARRKGYATEAVGATIAALHDHGFTHVAFGTAADNVANRSVAERVGASEERHGSHTLPNGEVIDAVFYVHTATDVVL